jgi:hypothetical protein
MTGSAPLRRRNQTGQFEASRRDGPSTSTEAGHDGVTPSLPAQQAGTGRPSVRDRSSIQPPPEIQESDGETPLLLERHTGTGRPSEKDRSSIRSPPVGQEGDGERPSLSELVTGTGRRSGKDPSLIQSPSIEEEASPQERLVRREGKLPAQRRSSTVPPRPHVDSEVASNYSLQEDETSRRSILSHTQAQRLRAIRAGENEVEARRLELEEAEAAVVDLRRSAQLKLPIRETRVITPAPSHQSTPAARITRQSETPSGGAIDLLAARKRVDQSERTDSHKRCHSTSSDASSHSRFKGMKPKEPGQYAATTIRQHQDWVRDCENVFDIMRREYRKDRKKVAYAQQFVHGDKRETWERKQKGRVVTWEYFCETLKDLIENPELRGYHQAVRFLSANQKDQTSSAFAAYLDQIEADLPLMIEDLRCLFFLCKLRPGL